jgi:trans-aconitate 2-methyltransferase
VAECSSHWGELTAELAKKWPTAQVIGVDNSAEMISKSAQFATARLKFEQKLMEDWQPSQPVDLLFSNAAYHWLRDHENQIVRLAKLVAPGGTFAFQAPNQFAEPSHTIIQEVRNSPEWNPLIGSDRSDGYVAKPEWYLHALTELGYKARVWETIYYQMVPSEDAALEWVKGTALRPLLAKLTPDQQERFLSHCRPLFAKAYPKSEGGTLFPYRRMFVVAKRT